MENYGDCSTVLFQYHNKDRFHEALRDIITPILDKFGLVYEITPVIVSHLISEGKYECYIQIKGLTIKDYEKLPQFIKLVDTIKRSFVHISNSVGERYYVNSENAIGEW
jgi:hypothetical protein